MDRVIYINPSGVQYQLETKNRFILSEEGAGMPEWDYVTERGPFQHGETVHDVFARPRVIQYIIRHKFCSRAEYWNGREGLVEILNPFGAYTTLQPQPGTLRKLQSNGKIRDIKVFIEVGPRFEPRNIGRWEEWSFQETIRFIAHNPIWYDPNLKTVSPSLPENLIFPITFPIVFGSYGGTVDISYLGNWIEYPTIVINGPITSPTITNQTTGHTISLSGYSVPAGSNVVITLTYSHKTVMLNGITNIAAAVTSPTDLAVFHFRPGINTIVFSGTGATNETSISINYFDRFLGG